MGVVVRTVPRASVLVGRPIDDAGVAPPGAAIAAPVDQEVPKAAAFPRVQTARVSQVLACA